MKKIRGNLPNVLTFTNMSLGIVAILISVSESKSNGIGGLILASLLIMVAAITDRFDGKVARMLDATSELGKELDSLSDLISFGVAPIVVTWKVSMVSLGLPGYLISLVFPIAGAYRLARYNVTEFDNFFRGIPITLAGAFLTIDNIYNCFVLMKKERLPIYHISVTIFLIIILSYLMVSKIRFKKV